MIQFFFSLLLAAAILHDAKSSTGVNTIGQFLNILRLQYNIARSQKHNALHLIIPLPYGMSVMRGVIYFSRPRAICNEKRSCVERSELKLSVAAKVSFLCEPPWGDF